MIKQDVDTKRNIFSFVEHKVNFNHKDYGNEFIPIEHIPFSLKQFWIKEWYGLPIEKKEIFINNNK